jgi:hypothetical protein
MNHIINCVDQTIYVLISRDLAFCVGLAYTSGDVVISYFLLAGYFI